MATPEGRRSLLTLHRLGESYGRRPSELAGIPDEWAAFQLDAAALALGRAIDSALQANAAKKQQLQRPPAEIVAELLGQRRPSGQSKPVPRQPRALRPGDPGWAEWAAVFGMKEAQ
ncbi:MAG: hypothetical protein FOGNACKC_02235 [Anaerolineae bacterium]|nr:hypothetical protein [Anaerolineae bacterium]